MNWAQPALFRQIDNTARSIGGTWSPVEIVRSLKKSNPKDFSRLTPQVVGKWICPIAKKQGVSQWSVKVMARVKRGNQPGGETTRTGVLVSRFKSAFTSLTYQHQHAYPVLCTAIYTRLKAMRSAGVPLTIITVRAIMVGYINQHAPHLFEVKQSDGSTFHCSEVFTRKYMVRHFGWSHRRATKAAKKLPDNLDEVLLEAFCREASLIRNYAIPPALRVNTDQTQIVYQQGLNMTWTERGTKQVPTIGIDEKRAFTAVPSISASGVQLPIQAIFHGKGPLSLPSKKCTAYAEATKLGMRLCPSKTDTYWSTHETMHDLVDNIIEPYLCEQKLKLGLPKTQYSIWKIDCWSVHKSKDFMDWMRHKHPRIIVLFIPANCTGVWQPLDVGLQRVMKLSIKRACHRDMVNEISAQLADDPDGVLKLDTRLGVLCNRSLGWMVAAFKDTNDVLLIKKVSTSYYQFFCQLTHLQAFELCRIGEFNCSHESLTSAKTLEMLADLPETNLLLFSKLSQSRLNDLDALGEEDAFSGDSPDDDSDIPLGVVAAVVELSGAVDDAGFDVADDGTVIHMGVAETDQDDIVRTESGDNIEQEAVLELPVVTWRSGRTVRPSTWYAGDVWERS